MDRPAKSEVYVLGRLEGWLGSKLGCALVHVEGDPLAWLSGLGGVSSPCSYYSAWPSEWASLVRSQVKAVSTHGTCSYSQVDLVIP